MKKRQVMSKGKRTFWLILRRIFAAAAVVIFVALSCNSTITVESNGAVYRQNISPFEKRDSFENSTLFNEILQEEVRVITRMAVIKSQLETEGSYNGQKKIDVASFAHRQEELPGETATAQFYLDDLIKWGNYGFVTETVCATEDELNSYFANGSSVFSLQNEMTENAVADWKSQSEETRTLLKRLAQEGETSTLSLRMIEELPSSEEEYRRMAEELGKYVGDAEILELNVLVPRYLSVEGLDLAEYATNVEEYVQLREDLKTTSKELFYNFTEYSENKNAYSANATNIRYCYRMSVDGEICYFTNLEGRFEEKKLEEITRDFEAYGRYIYYNADRAEIETNTSLNADMMKQEMKYYQYAFGDNTRVWLAVDTSYPAADGFWMAREAYNRLMPYYGYLAALLVLLAALSLVLFLHVTRYEGRRETEGEGYRIVLHKADHVRTELFLILAAAFVVGSCYLSYLAFVFCIRTWEDALHSFWLPFAAGVVAFLVDYGVMFFWLSMVRRAKAHTFWSNSLLRMILLKIRSGIFSLYDHSHILVRTLVPFIVILILNLVLGDFGIPGILTAAVIDIASILFLYQEKKALWEIVERTKRIGQGDFDLKIGTEKLHGENRELAEAVNGIGDGIKTAVEQSMKDERLKADLITNVSHDIKTPLTSIINFVNLLKREKIEDERIRGYIDVLDAKSQRLKQLTDDLVEASKITSGNISLQMERINFAELVNQTCGEFSDKFREKCLEMVLSMPDGPLYIEADSRRIWRVVENLFSNAYKYALEGTRVYLDVKAAVVDGKRFAVFSMKNISAQALNIDASELTERFIRGDISRSTEGSGLGLSIAKNLTELQNGKFDIYLDGDLFKVLVTFPCLDEEDGASLQGTNR